MVPSNAAVLYGAGSVMSSTSADISTALYNLLGMSSTTSFEAGNPVMVMTRPDWATTTFTIGVSCSEIYSLITFVIFSLFFAYMIRDKLWKKAALVTAGLPLIYSRALAGLAVSTTALELVFTKKRLTK